MHASSRSLRSCLPLAFALLSIPFLASCGGGGGGGGGTGAVIDDGGNPTITTYAPQTLNKVQLEVGDATTGGTAIFVFTSTARQSPETEIGTFEYTNVNDTDIFVDAISNGTYHYRVTAPDRGILTLTGGNPDPGPSNPVVFANLKNGVENDLDFTINAGSTSSLVVVNIGRRTPPLIVTGLVSVDGMPLPLNYGGTADTREPDPNVATSLDGRTYTLADQTGNARMLTFTATNAIGNLESGTFTSTVYQGTYEYVSDTTGDAPSALRLFIEVDDGEGNIEIILSILSLTYNTPTSGTFTSIIGPFSTAGLSKPFIVN